MTRPDRAEAVQLRRDGVTYEAILQRLGMAKSTLWCWLKAEGMVDGQSQQYTERRLLAQRKAAEVVHRRRVQRTQAIRSKAAQEVSPLTLSELRLIGTALYWAEGAKQKERSNQVSEGVVFGNTDPRMLRLFVRFLTLCCGVDPLELRFRIYLHETADALETRTYWCNQVGLEVIKITPITWKRHKPTAFRTNVGKDYHGLLRIIVPRSAGLNRRITGWIDGICSAGE